MTSSGHLARTCCIDSLEKCQQGPVSYLYTCMMHHDPTYHLHHSAKTFQQRFVSFLPTITLPRTFRRSDTRPQLIVIVIPCPASVHTYEDDRVLTKISMNHRVSSIEAQFPEDTMGEMIAKKTTRRIQKLY